MPSRIPPELVDRIRESSDIVDLISGYVKLERKGGNYFGLCPFHTEKTPSFSVHPGKGIFHCFGCGAGGNAFTFLQLHDKLSFAEAARELAKRCGIVIPERVYTSAEDLDRFDALYRANEFAAGHFSRSLWEGKGEEVEQAREYLKHRQISVDLGRAFRMGFAADKWDGLQKEFGRLKPSGVAMSNMVEAGLLLRKEGSGPNEGGAYDRFRGRLIFPILNQTGRVVAFGGRILKASDQGAKYINSPQTPIYNKGQLLYGLYQAKEQIRQRGECLIVEGYTDLMRCHEAGFVHAVATSGTALTQGQAQTLKRLCRRAILVYDGDAAGSHAAVRGSDVLLAADVDVRVIGLPPEHDPDSFIRAQGPAAFRELMEKSQDVISYRIELYRREGKLLDAPSRGEAARELLDTLAVIHDPIKREITTTEAARQIGLSPDTLLRELNLRRTRGSGQNSSNNAPVRPTADQPPIKERTLIEALLRWPELRSAAFAEITAIEFKDGVLRRIATRLEDAWVSGREMAGEELIAEDLGLEDTAFVSAALAQSEAEAEPGVDRRLMRRYLDYRSAHDCLRDLLQERLNRAYQKLQAELVGSDPEQVRRLTQELKELLERQKSVRQRAFWNLPGHPSMEFTPKEPPLPGIGPAEE